jgi:hypothetical protein
VFPYRHCLQWAFPDSANLSVATMMELKAE